MYLQRPFLMFQFTLTVPPFFLQSLVFLFSSYNCLQSYNYMCGCLSSGTIWSWDEILTSVLILNDSWLTFVSHHLPTCKRACTQPRASWWTGKEVGRALGTPWAHWVCVHFFHIITSPLSCHPSLWSPTPHTASLALASKMLIPQSHSSKMPLVLFKLPQLKAQLKCFSDTEPTLFGPFLIAFPVSDCMKTTDPPRTHKGSLQSWKCSQSSPWTQNLA